MVVVTYEAGRLQIVNKLILLLQLPVEWDSILVAVPFPVEPYSANLAVICEKLGQLIVHKFVVCGPILVVSVTANHFGSCSSQRIFVAHPVNMRVVKMQFNALLVALVGKFLYYVAAKGGSIHDVKVRLVSVPH